MLKLVLFVVIAITAYLFYMLFTKTKEYRSIVRTYGQVFVELANIKRPSLVLWVACIVMFSITILLFIFML